MSAVYAIVPEDSATSGLGLRRSLQVFHFFYFFDLSLDEAIHENFLIGFS